MQKPLTSGNSFIINQYLETVANCDTQFFINYLYERNYFTNLYTIENDPELKEIWPELVALRFDNGVCAFKKIGKYYCVLGLSEIKKKLNGEIISARGSLYNNSELTNHDSIALNDSNCIFVKLNQLMLPSLLYLWNFLKQKQRLIDSFETNILSSTIKGVIQCENPEDSSIDIELQETLMNPKKSFIKMPKMVGMNSKDFFRIEALDLGAKTNLTVGENIEWYIRYNYRLLGRKYNVEETKDHVNPNDTDLTKDNFVILENENKKYLEVFIEKYNKMFNKSAKLVAVGADKEEQEIELPANDNV